MENITCVENCYGCKVCVNKCSFKAIVENYDPEGFFYPKVNQEKCTHCGLCVKVCPSGKLSKNIGERAVYGVKNANIEKRINATSGGFFEIIASYFIESGGVVYAPAFDKDYRVTYIKVQSINEIEQCKGSKYVQSDLSSAIYQQLEKDVDSKKVLFVGTPCQCQGIKNAFPNKKGLFLLDFYCHGVPGQGVWANYVNHLAKRGAVKDYKFRDKKSGWHKSSISYVQKNKIIRKKIGEDKFSRWFFNKKMFRNSCYKCAFRTPDRVGDITMGDFWGIDKIDSDFDDEAGVSLITVNSEKGYEIWKAIKYSFEYKEYTENAIPTANFSKRKVGIKTKIFKELYHLFPCYFVFSLISGISKKSVVESIIHRRRNSDETS